ncbi:retron St85 family RNA-directed DNA polymerase [Gallaecimonas mangrovi]|uniref:retron St85 family RNA-directed DNA polymerase n=1 Tax=Gallaecimonas mangrovi TaxID=2291597 RepID=UPI000E204908|nr:retron St85 family RNA-directed DNA polymerase [Gallaecimonas mangrovi]
MHIKKAIANDLSIPDGLIDEAISVARAHVKIFHIQKRSGGSREICHPSKKLKTLQYWLIHSVFSQMQVHDASMAYRDGVSILHNAEKHRSNRFFLKMDLENFFHSISFEDFIPILRSWHRKSNPKWILDAECEDMIRRICFYKNDRLAIGYPSSPIISNIVMNEFDSKVSTLISDRKYGKVIYTRYADDLVLSTDKKGACSEIIKEIINLIQGTSSPNISVNHSKTKLGSSTGGSASVTGLKICSGGHITIHRKQKDHIRLLLSLYRKGKLEQEEENSLLGHLSYCHYVAPDFYTKLSKKYFKEIYDLRSKDL